MQEAERRDSPPEHGLVQIANAARILVRAVEEHAHLDPVAVLDVLTSTLRGTVERLQGAGRPAPAAPDPASPDPAQHNPDPVPSEWAAPVEGEASPHE